MSTNSLTVSPSSRSVSNAAGSTSFSVASNVSWSVSDDAGWMSFTPSSGSNNGTITVNYDENTSSSSRTGTLTVSGGGITRNVTVVQQGQAVEPYLTVTPSNLYVNNNAGSINFNIESNISWEIKHTVDWLGKNPNTGSGNATITVNYQSNSTSGSRSATLNVNGTGGLTKQVILTQDAVLPVELTTFTANLIEKNVQLAWTTATEVNNYGFEVERKFQRNLSENVLDWEKVGFVHGHGNSNSPKYYHFYDDGISRDGLYFYRLKQIDIDGQYEYSDIVEVNIEITPEFSLSQNYPNPFNPVTKINFNIPEDGIVTISIYNILGEKIAVLLNQHLLKGSHSVDFDGNHINSGVYFYRLEYMNNSIVKNMTLVK